MPRSFSSMSIPTQAGCTGTTGVRAVTQTPVLLLMSSPIRDSDSDAMLQDSGSETHTANHLQWRQPNSPMPTIFDNRRSERNSYPVLWLPATRSNISLIPELATIAGIAMT